MKNPAPKSCLLLAGTVLGAIPEVGQYIGDAVSALSNFIVLESFKNIDLDLANIQGNLAQATANVQDAYEAGFQQLMNGDPTHTGGALQVLKGGRLIKSFSVCPVFKAI
jgi:hypothetical protein